jgi:hypothetical protein
MSKLKVDSTSQTTLRTSLYLIFMEVFVKKTPEKVKQSLSLFLSPPKADLAPPRTPSFMISGGAF